MTNSASISDSVRPVDGPMLEEARRAAHAALAWDVEHRPTGAGSFARRIAALRRSYRELEKSVATSGPIPGAASDGNRDEKKRSRADALLLLRENARLVRTAVVTVASIPKSIAELPRVVLAGRKDEPRVAALASVYLTAVELEFSTQSLCVFLEELQTQEALLADELWSIPTLLQFALVESLLEDAHALLMSVDAGDSSRLTRLSREIGSLREIGLSDWASLLEPLIRFDATLRDDPAQAYDRMDFESRDFYRRRVAFLARHSDCTESKVAQSALALAKEAAQKPVDERVDDPRLRQRMIHVGYYLIDEGFEQLAASVGFHGPFLHRLRRMLRRHADEFYITGIQLVTVLVIAAVIVPVVPHASLFACIALTLLLMLPAMQNAVELANSTVTALFDPQPLAKIDFSHGIAARYATLVAVPTLLLHEDQVRGLAVDLEARYLANRDPNLHFALLTDLPDSVTKPHDKDFDPLVALAVELIDGLNGKYCSRTGGGAFLLLHRHRVFNVRQGVWMGWERKRGKLLDLNKMLAHEYDAFPIKAGPLDALNEVRYILTLDSDTQLPHGSAARLIGAMAHPLNQAVIDPKRRIVTAGYGILQPRIGVAVQSASRSRLAALYSGQTGFDIYTRAVSDAYQDLYGEGSFTGKGIYEVATLHTVLDRRFPRNALLSHDLIEGAYARAGLATDIELIDDYPSHLSAYNRRKHRWVRGDWQIVQWILSRVPEESGRRVPNPISDVSRWKIFDNLRRSLVDPLTFLLFTTVWHRSPGGPLYWTLILLGLLFLPAWVQLGFGLARALAGGAGAVTEALSGFLRTLLVTFLNLVFLPQQAMLSIDAIVRSLVRRFITGKRLLEWETAAQAEAGSAKRTPVERYLALSPLVAIGIAVSIYLTNRDGSPILVASPMLLLWVVSPLIARWLNGSPVDRRRDVSPADEAFLKAQALRIWRYFREFGGERHNYLIPDNVEESGLFEAARVSPTNLGLLLNARQAACAFGFLTVPEFADLTRRSLDTVARLEKHRGHLYNWYDTETLKPLGGRSVSSVDSGNLVASLYTLHTGVHELLTLPLLSGQLFTGLDEFIGMMREESRGLEPLRLPQTDASIDEWMGWLLANRARFLEIATGAATGPNSSSQPLWWAREMVRRVDGILNLARDYMPWLLPKFAAMLALPEVEIEQDWNRFTIGQAAAFCAALQQKLSAASEELEDGLRSLAEELAGCLPEAARKLIALEDALRGIARDSEALAEATEFGFLVSPERKLLSIGYDVEAQKLHGSCYDLLASEARIATFLAIARNDLPQQSWFKMGREHTAAYGRFVLLSWTGTMFEYLMPALWMRNYPDTLIWRTMHACLHAQIAFTQTLKLPWGISESGFAEMDEAGHYQYRAFGLPAVALKVDASAGPVVSPYSTFLALGVSASGALRNLRRMESLGWVGAYGFYEAVDCSTAQGGAVLVREWMAHHQGMSLLAVLNLLESNAAQRWFHANPLVQSAELLLHEMPVPDARLRAAMREFPALRPTA